MSAFRKFFRDSSKENKLEKSVEALMAQVTSLKKTAVASEKRIKALTVKCGKLSSQAMEIETVLEATCETVAVNADELKRHQRHIAGVFKELNKHKEVS